MPSRKAAAGAGQLSTGAATLAAGQQSALDGAAKLADGAHSSTTGAAQLASGAATAVRRLPHLGLGTRQGRRPSPEPERRPKEQRLQGHRRPRSSQQRFAGQGWLLWCRAWLPFFLTLALWIGVFMLVQAMRPITQRALASNAPSWKIAVGGWLPFFVVSVSRQASSPWWWTWAWA